MDKSDLAGWGLELEPDEFARALCAAGVMTSWHPDLREALDQDPVEWFRPSRPGVIDDPSPAQLAAAWSEAVARRRDLRAQPLSLAIVLPDRIDPTWVIRTILASPTGVDGAYVRRDAPPGRLSWNWPLEVGVLDDEASESLDQELRGNSRSIGAGVRLITLGPGTHNCDLLLLPYGLSDALARTLREDVSASCVAVLGRSPLPWRRAQPLAAALAAHLDAGGLALNPVEPGERAAWLDALAGSLRSDEPLDVAFARASPQSPPPLLASPELIEATRISRVGARLSRHIEDRVANISFAQPPQAMPDGEAIEVASLLRVAGPESIVELAPQAREAIAERPPARFLQARLSEENADGNLEPVGEGPLRARTAHAVEVRIAPPDHEWKAGREAFPTDGLDRSQIHGLTVAFVELAEGGASQVQRIALPPNGPSSGCRFFVSTREPGSPLAARIVVLHENRVLQTALLRAEVGQGATEGPFVEVVTEAVLRLELDDLDDRSRFGGTLLLNHAQHGAPGITAISGGEVSFRAAASFSTAIEDIRDILEQAAVDPTGFDDLHDRKTLDLLIDLANRGAPLRGFLEQQPGFHEIVAAERVQVVAFHPESYFPVEFIYSGLAPDASAELCPNAERALEVGECPDCRSRTERSVVCPLGFWGLAKVIERQAYVPAPADGGSWDFVFTSERTRERKQLSTAGAAVFAASKRVDEEVAGGRDAVAAALEDVTDDKATRAEEWSSWRDGVETTSPALLVLLPHTFKHRFGPAFEIGEGGEARELPMSHLDEHYVRTALASPPIVFLLGCSTADTELPYLSFPGAFRTAGAAIVVATLTKILGRHAAPVAGRLAQLLAERSDERDPTFGHALTSMRRELMREGRPLAMALVAYGDADWALTREPMTAAPRQVARVLVDA